MFRKILMATTALVVASSMALAAGVVVRGHHPNNKPELLLKLKDARKRAHEMLIKHLVPSYVVPLSIDRLGLPVNGIIHPSQSGTEDTKQLLPPGGNFSGSKNAYFLSFLGWFADGIDSGTPCYGAACISHSSSACYSYNSTHSQCVNRQIHQLGHYLQEQKSIALPIMGDGKMHGHIKVGVESVNNTPAAGTVAIYSNSGSNTPGSVITGASTNFTAPAYSDYGPYCCKTEQILRLHHATTLTAGTKYWVVITGADGNGTNNEILWSEEDTDFSATGAVTQGADYRTHGTSARFTGIFTTRYDSSVYYSNGGPIDSGWLNASGGTNFPPAVFVE